MGKNDQNDHFLTQKKKIEKHRHNTKNTCKLLGMNPFQIVYGRVT